LGIYWAWVDPNWAKDTRSMGFLAAAGGALIGAWLGLNATAGLLALITSILGAAAAANLALIAHDVSRARSARSAATLRPPPPAQPTLSEAL
jgi:hypothetical protein